MKDLLSNRESNPDLLNKSRTTHPSDLISELTVTGSHDLYGMFLILFSSLKPVIYTRPVARLQNNPKNGIWSTTRYLMEIFQVIFDRLTNSMIEHNSHNTHVTIRT